MTTSTDLAAAIEAFIREEVQRQLAAALAELESTPAPTAPPRPRPRLSTAQAAARAGRHPRTIADASGSGDLLATQRGSQGSWRIDPAALDAWMRGTPDYLVPGWAGGADPELPRYLDTADAAAYAGRSRDTILKACQSGTLVATQRVKSGTWAVRPASIDSWLSSRRTQAEMTAEVNLKQEIWDELAKVLSTSSNSDVRQAAFQRRENRYDEAGLELHTIGLAEQGREPLAEQLVEQFHGGSRVDVVLVGLGLLCGLVASIWGTWLPSA